MKMVLIELHRDLYEGLEKACSLPCNPDVTTLLNALVLSYLNSVGCAPQSGIFVSSDEEM